MGLDRSTPRLRVRLFGSVEVSIDSGDARRFPTRKSELLFGYLALHRDRFCLRDSLAAALWGDCSNQTARKSLRTELWRVRSLLEPDSRSSERLLTVRRDGVRLATSADLWLDVEEFERTVLPLAERPGQALDPERSGLRQAVALYRGDFLAGHDEEWCLFARERYRALFLSSLERLMDHWLAEGKPAAALDVGNRILHHDPLLERINRHLMRCHYLLGDRAAALRQYLRFAELLERELDVRPMEQTRALYERIRHQDDRRQPGEVVPFSDTLPHAGLERSAQLDFIVHELHSAGRVLTTLAGQLQSYLEEGTARARHRDRGRRHPARDRPSSEANRRAWS